jgi:hypothetical protein
MTQCSRLGPVLLTISALAVAGLVPTSFAWAAEPDAAPMATAPAASAATSGPPISGSPAAGAPAPMTIGEQIDNYLKTSPAAALPKDNALGVTSTDEPRQIHGMVDLAAGSNGYRSAYVASELPIGKTATATIAVRETQFKGRFGGYGGGYGGGPFSPETRQSVGLGLSFNGSSDAADPRCRQAADDSAVNLDPRFGGGRACRTMAPSPP